MLDFFKAKVSLVVAWVWDVSISSYYFLF
jgi:hypothetical protein